MHIIIILQIFVYILNGNPLKNFKNFNIARDEFDAYNFRSITDKTDALVYQQSVLASSTVETNREDLAYV